MSALAPMIADLPLFAPRARRTDPETSHVAAASMAGGATRHRERILAHLRTVEDATKDEIGAAVGLTDVQAARRLSELKAAGEIEDSGARRPTASGRPAIAWRAR